MNPRAGDEQAQWEKMMVDSRVLQIGVPTTAGGNRVAGAASGLVAALVRRLSGRGADAEEIGVAANDRELAALANRTPERRFDLGKSQALALKSGFSGSWLA